ncbi:valine--pyruvate transaminase [Spartinivicinus ruber]|uniref:valine--pyruvate transaminase n=1 Tax=Spartinivicinus ruber TaxID=2683272 RepID=UPI0013D4C8F9|nr:valine--pyruvate transaminase [Spartinivicinus ruber]
MKLSNFGEKFTGQTGIQSLMSDLGNALASDQPMIMMGGGNPAHIPQVEETFKARLRRILDNHREFVRLIGTYDPPQGEKEFISALVNLLNNQFGWGLTTRNIALTNGSQSAFFMLFNMFAGQYPDGSQKQILFPLAPEYIGYADAGLSDHFFTANRPSIELIDQHTFKYHVDFTNLKVTDNTGAICVSRPTNPTGNVLTDQEIEHLDKLAKQHDIPLFIDGAYGTPFPNLIFTEATPYWNENIILCLSLSKLGLPACRTGIVIANEAVIESVTKINAILSLATNSAGSLLAMDMVKDSSILTMSNEIIKPFYQNKVEKAVNTLHQALDGYDYYIHKPEGAMFLWLWFKDLPITSLELYQRLKDKGVIVVSGHYFFPGITDNDWRHQQECIRITYSQDDEKVAKGLNIIADEVKKAYQES